MEFHEVASIFPLMSEAEIQALAEDIGARGLLEKIWRHEGKIIDGRNRYLACSKVNVEPQYRDWDGKGDLVQFVVSYNLKRRHLTPAHLAMCAARARAAYDDQAKERQREAQDRGRKGQKGIPANLPESNHGDARDQVGETFGVSGRSVDYATKIIENAVPEIVRAVDEGRMAVSTAAILATEPIEVQVAESQNPKRRRTYQSVTKPRHQNGESDGEQDTQEEPTDEARPKVLGLGVILANEAINSLTRIPKNDALRKRGFQLVTDWIRHNP